MAVATRVIGNPAVAALLTTLDMAAERGRAALLDRRHHLELIEAHTPGIGSPPIGSMAMEDVRDLQPMAAHGRRSTLRVSLSPRLAMRAGRAGRSRCGSWY